MSTKKHLYKTLTRGITIVSLFSLFLPYHIFAQGTSQIGEVCTKDDGSECITGTCEQKKETSTKYCVCKASVGNETDGAEQCAARYSSLDPNPGSWQCEQGIGGSYDLNYCQNQNTDQSQAPAGTTGGSSWWELITDTTAAVQFNAEELNKLLKKPSLRINIPGVSFTDPNALPLRVEGNNTYIYIPYIGEYIAPFYKYGIAAIAVFSIVMIINAGFTWITSGGNSEGVGRAQKGIVQAITGLLIAVTSYSLLYLINPELVNFRSLKIQVISKESISSIPDNEETSRISDGEERQPLVAGAKNNRDLTVSDPQNFCFPVTDGFDKNSKNWGQSRKINNEYVQCHHGLDLYTHGEELKGTVIAMTDAKVLYVYREGFTNCSQGKSNKTASGTTESVGYIAVYDATHNLTYVYGEVNGDSIIDIKQGDMIQKGQTLAIASKCNMLHLEIYQGKGLNRGEKLPLQGKEPKVANWYLYDSLNLPKLIYGRNECMKSPYIDILDTTGSKLLNPMPFIEQITGNAC